MNDIVALHREEFETEPDVIASAPGTTSLLGDFSEIVSGSLLCLGLSASAQVAMSFRDDASLRVFTPEPLERRRVGLSNLKYRREDRWVNFIKGVLFEMEQRGAGIRGLNVTVVNNIPRSAGLHASTALTEASLRAVDELFACEVRSGESMDVVAGVMRDYAGLEVPYHAVIGAHALDAEGLLLTNTSTWEYRRVSADMGDAVFVVVNTGVPSDTLAKDLAQIRDDCDVCLDVLVQASYGGSGAPGRTAGLSLQEFDEADLLENMGMVSERVRRRCRHVITEMARVRKAEADLRLCDLDSVGRIMQKSHQSFRDLLEVSCPEVDWIVKRAAECDGIYGAKITGAGGCAVLLLEREAAPALGDILEEYERIFGFDAELITSRPLEGLRLKTITY